MAASRILIQYNKGQQFTNRLISTAAMRSIFGFPKIMISDFLPHQNLGVKIKTSEFFYTCFSCILFSVA